MKKIIAWTLTVIAGPLLVAFLQPHLPAALSLSWPWVIAVSEWHGLPWVLAGIIGFQIGLWFDRWVSAFDGRNPITKSGKAKNLAPKVGSIALRCEVLLAPASRMHVDENELRAEILMIGEKLAHLGTDEPHLPPDMSREDMLSSVAVMFRAIRPALADGDVKTAVMLSKTVRTQQIAQSSAAKKPAG